ncbi:POTRA domain-containing protein [Fluviispira multicolorata]|uniref:POTRA domain-containing protein n=1 Tax=Fluviispira multicolorata TaxID=2654512 RepID=UPI001375D56E|nr:POTRA domain-containing protein [Fluviispira multicolorata]
MPIIKTYGFKKILIFLFLFYNIHIIFNHDKVFAQDLDTKLVGKEVLPINANNLIIKNIEINGNTQTSDDIILEQITLKENNRFYDSDLKNTIQNLKNLQIFLNIEIKLYKLNSEENNIYLKINVEEKWTLLPYFLTGSGGGSSYLVVGLYDTNFLGRLYTFNFTYGCKNDNCSTFIFFRNPSILGGPVNLVINGARQHDIFHTYDKDRNITGSFSNKRNMLTSYADIKITNALSLGGGFIFYENNINTDGISNENIATNNNLNYNLPPSTTSLALEGRLTLGSINYDGIISSGVNFTSILDTTANMYTNPQNNYTALNNTLLFFHPNIPFGLFNIPLPRQSYLAIRANLSLTTSDILPQQYFLGGLDKIRGYYDNEFSGKFAWFSNIELRIPSYIGEYLTLQHAIFSDAGNATEKFENIVSPRTATSVGVGIRFLPMKINRVAIRLDYAYTLTPFHTFGFSFGLLQFF